MNEQLIIELLTSRSEGAIRELSNLYGEKCMSIATGILNSREDAEECVNDAYLAVWNSIPPERPDSLAAYLYRIVRNIALMKYRYNTAEKRNSRYDVALGELEEFLKSTDDVHNMMEAKELSALINRFLHKQKKIDRTIFIKRYWLLMDITEIAGEMGISRNYVNVHLHRTRERLKKVLNREGYYD